MRRRLRATVTSTSTTRLRAVREEPLGQRFPQLLAWCRRPDVMAGFAVALTMVVAGVIRNPWIVTQGRIEDGDFAINSILIDRAKHGRLLYGNYSRVGFNHPGPALMYIQSAGEVVFHQLLRVAPRPYNGHVLGVLVHCGAMVGLSSAVAVRRTSNVLAAGLVLLGGLIIGVGQPGSMVSTSFPEIYIWSYLVFVVAAASVLTGGWRDLPLVVLGAGLLCHGHVSFFLFVGGFAAVLAIRWWRSPPDGRPTRGIWFASGAVATVFAAPFLLNLIVNWPGEVDDYWRYSRASNTGGHSWAAIARFIGQFWSATDLFGYVMAAGLFLAAVAITASAADHSRSFLRALLVSSVLSTVLLVVYARRGIDDLSYRYVAEFYITAPVVALLVIGMVGVELADRWRAGNWMVWGALAVSVLVIGGQSQMKALYGGANWVEAAEGFLDDEIGEDGVRVMRFPLDVWPGVAGIVEQSRRTGDEVCIDEPALAFLFDDSMICDDVQRASGIVVVALPAGQRGTVPVDARYESANIVLEIVPKEGP